MRSDARPLRNQAIASTNGAGVRRPAAVASTPRARPNVAAPEPRRETVDRLLDAAEAEFARHGFEAARLEDIAASVGLRRASLLYHFASKQELYERVLERAFGDMQAMLVGTLGKPAKTHVERLDDLIGEAIDTFTGRPTVAQLILRDALDSREEREGLAAERARRFVAPLLSLGDAFFRSGQAIGELRTGIDARDVLLFFTSSVLFHAAIGEAQRDVLWGDGRASRDAVARHRASACAMLRDLVRPEKQAETSTPKQPVEVTEKSRATKSKKKRSPR